MAPDVAAARLRRDELAQTDRLQGDDILNGHGGNDTADGGAGADAAQSDPGDTVTGL